MTYAGRTYAGGPYAGRVDAPVVAPSGPSYTAVVLADSPLVYYRLGDVSGNPADSSGNGHNAITALQFPGQTGLLISDPTAKSAGFSGGSAWVDCNYGDWFLTGSMSTEAVIRPSDISGNRSITDRHDWSNGNVFQFRLNSGRVEVIIWTSDGNLFGATGATTISVNTTHHVAATYDQTTGIARVYLDGAQDGQASTTAGKSLSQAHARLSIGANRSLTGAAAAQQFAGNIQEAAVYGTALSATRVAAHSTAAFAAAAAIPTTITGGKDTEADTARAGTVTKGPVTKQGGQATESDTARAGSVGNAPPSKAVPGGRASETDTARAGGVTGGRKSIPGGRADETDTTRAGGLSGPTTIPGGKVVETDAARAGVTSTPALTVPTSMDLLLLDENDTFDSDQISSAGDRTHWWSYTPTEVLDLTFDLDDTVPVDWVPTVDPDTDVESDPPPVDAVLTLYTGTSVNTLSVVASGSSITPTGLAVGTTYYVRASIPAGDPDVLYQLSVGPAADTQLYLMDLEVLSGPLRGAPTAVVVQVMGGPADDTVTFKIDGVAVPGTWDLDPFGNLPPTSVAVPEATTKGDHIISVHSDSTDLAGEGTFTLSRNPYVELQTVGLDADPVEIAEANTSTGVRRWVLQDLMPGGLGSWVMVRNPTSMSSPEYQRTLFQEHTTAKDGQYHLSSVALQSFEWTFSGYVDTEFEQNQLLAYYGLNRRFYVIDHRTRAWMVAWQRCEIVPRKRQRNDDSSFNDWAADYTVTALIYDQDPRVPR